VSPVLSVSGVAKRYGELQALRDVSFEARSGELVAVVGPNGAGKTTLLSIIAGAQQPSAGTVSTTVVVPAGRSEVGWAPQQPALYSKLSVTENLRLFARLEKVADPDRAVERMLEQTGLSERADDRLDRLSGGNRQRVNLAIGLIADPPVLALDEPSASLDPAQRGRLWEFIDGLAKAGTTVVFSTHNVVEAQRYADRAIVLDEGELVFDDAPQALMRAVGQDDAGDFERALVSFLAERADL
jgi:ABC-2 type transport system ATP-binding protein